LRIRAFFLLVLVPMLAFASCGRDAPATCRGPTVRLVRENILTFGTDFAFPPFAFDHPDTGAPVGFEVDLAKAIAEQLGVKLLLVNRTSANLIPGLLAHRHDIAASAQLDAPELRREVCVTRSYLNADLGLLARAGTEPSVKGVGDLDGRAVAVVKGSRAEAWTRGHVGGTTSIVRVDAPEDLLTALRGSQVDGAINDLSVLRFQQVRAKDVVVVGEIVTGDHYVFAVGPDNRGLAELVNKALDKIRASGTLDAIKGKWFGP
jgi:polar amino acid transport system substrate-binding protein